MSINEHATLKNTHVTTYVKMAGKAVGLVAVAFGLLTTSRNASAQTFQTTPIIAGYQDFNFNGGGVTSAVTANKPESKLWYHDGFWWAVMWDNVVDNYRIFRFDSAARSWTNTGVNVDDRPRSSADVLWDGTKLYVMSRAKLTHKAADGPDLGRLYRYSYDSVGQTFAFDDSVSIPGTEKTASLVLTKDSNGKLWVAWNDTGFVKVNRTTTDDFTWGTAFNLPVQGSATDALDLATITAFGGDRIGILWSNVIDPAFYFAVHVDDSTDTAWEARETVASGTRIADDHLNLACSVNGTVIAVVKTSLVNAGDPLVLLVKRDPVLATWSTSPVWNTEDNPTRPTVVLNSETDSLYVFAKTTSTSPKSIVMKTAHLSNPVFNPGLGTIFMQSASDFNINNPTSTKDCVTAATGLLILASDKDSRNYIHNFIDFGNFPPVALPDSGSTEPDVAVVLDVTANDTDTDGVVDKTTVTIVDSASNGTTSVDGITGAVTYTPGSGFVGRDTLRYTVSDDGGANALAPIVVINVIVTGTPVAVNDTVATALNTAFDIDVLANDSHTGGQTLNPASVTVTSFGPFNGTATVNTTTGAINYTPNSNFTGTDLLRYTVQDGLGATSEPATVTIRVDNPPVAGNDAGVTSEDVSVDVDVVANDSDIDGTIDSTTVFISSAPANGSTAVNANTGVVTYTPDQNFSGADSFGYTVADNDGIGSNEATVTVTISPVNDPPLAINDTVSTPEETAIEIDVVANDSDVDGTINSSTVVVTVQPSNGQVSVDSTTGAITYTPNINFFGQDSLDYSVNDDLGLTSNEARIHITVNSVNDAPVAVDDTASTQEESAVAIAVVNNDTDSDGTIDTTSVLVVQAPQHGTTSVSSATGEITYTPETNFVGSDSLQYTVNDNGGQSSNNATVRITVTDINDAPVAIADSASTLEETAVEIDVAANDTDIDGTVISTSVVIATPAANGTTVVDGTTGRVTYTPELNFVGIDSFTYTVDDEDGATSLPGTVSVTVTDVNDPPVAVPDSSFTNEEMPVDVNVAANDTDIDGTIDPTSVVITTGPANGSAVVSGTPGIISYTPAINFVGFDSLKYAIRDNDNALSSDAFVVIAVGDINDVPVAHDDSVTTPEEASVNIDVISNDTDIDGVVDPTTVTVVKSPRNGVTSVHPLTGVVIYTPNMDFVGSDTLDYIVRDNDGDPSNQASVFITVTNVNDAPVAVDDTANTDAGFPVEIDVSANDFDVDGNVVISSILSGPGTEGGTSVNPVTGKITYTSGPDFFGTDSFIYLISDNDGAISNLGTVTVFVNARPVAANDSVLTNEGTAVDIDILGNDTDADGSLQPATVKIATVPTDGSTAIDTTTGAITYTPNGGFSGMDSFTYTVKDDAGGESDAATVKIDVNDTPVAGNDIANTDEGASVAIVVLVNDSDSDGVLDSTTVTVLSAPPNGSATIDPVTGVITYTPNGGFSGNDSFSYTVKDDLGVASNAATVTVFINDLPVAVNDTTSTGETIPVDITILANDTDSDGTLDPAGIFISVPPGNGGVSIDTTTGVVTYTANSGFQGQDTFSYSVRDDDGAASNLATVLVNVNDTNFLPIAKDDTTTTDEDMSVLINILGNDSDPDGSLVNASIEILSFATHGTVTADTTNGTATYLPEQDFFGADSFAYRVSDNEGGLSNSANVRITVNSVNDLPTVGNDSLTTVEDTPKTVAVLDNDNDLDGSLAPSTVTVVSGPANGTTSIDSITGSITYTPTLNYNGPDSLTYTVDDNEGGRSPQATVFITVTGQNDLPVAANDTVNVNKNASIEIDVLGNDADSDGNLALATVTIVSQPLNGTATVNSPGGTITYVPNSFYFGGDSLDYKVQDSAGGVSNIARVFVTVLGTNEMPIAVDDTVETLEDVPKTISILANDNDLDGTLDFSSLIFIRNPVQGSASIDTSTGKINYAPDADFFGNDTLSYTVNDDDGATSNEATVFITIATVNDAPLTNPDSASTLEDNAVVVDVLANDQEIDGTIDKGSVTVVTGPDHGSTQTNTTTGGITYTPAPNFFGVDSLRYTVNDDFGMPSVPTKVKITVSDVNDPPVAVDDSVSTTMDAAVSIVILANDTDVDGQVVVQTLTVTLAANGTTSISSSGIVTYTPNSGFGGTDFFTYSFRDDDNAPSNVATVRITVGTLPIAKNDTVSTDEDVAVALQVLNNDFDPDGSLDTTSVTVTIAPKHGSAVATAATGIIDYTPDTNFFGGDTLSYTVKDDEGNVSLPATVFLTINDVNDAPVAINDTVSTLEDTPLVIAVTGNDQEVDGTLVLSTLTITRQPVHGGVSIDQNSGEFTYTPDANFSGSDTLAYTVKDDDAAVSNQASVFVTVQTVNDAPISSDDVAETDEDMNVIIDVIANDSDVDGTIDSSSVVVTEAARNGSTAVNANTGAITYTPNADFFGPDTLGYTVKDNTGLPGNPARVVVTVNSINDAPVAVNDSVFTPKGIPVDINVLTNDSDVDGTLDPATLSATVAANGATALKPGGIITYTPNPDFDGTDTFTYSIRDNSGAISNLATVTILIGAPPVAVNDTVTVKEDSVVVISVADNDTDNDGSVDPATVTITSNVANGNVVLNQNAGEVTYTPAPDFFGEDTLKYTIKDNSGAVSNEGTVFITVLSVNDNPVAVNDTVSTAEDTQREVDVALNDNDIDGSLDLTTVTVVANPSNGTFAVNTTTGVITYSPSLNFSGADSLDYTIRDNEGGLSNSARVFITVSGQNDLPVAINDTVTTNEDAAIIVDVKDNDSDSDGSLDSTSIVIGLAAQHGVTSLTAAPGKISYVPNTNFFGADSFKYTIKDDFGATSNQATVHIAVVNINDAPVVVNDTVATPKDVPVLIQVLLNDSDTDGTIDVTTLSLVRQPKSGIAVPNPGSGSISYTPNAGFVGNDTLSYTVRDDSAAISLEALVFVSVFDPTIATLTFGPTDDGQVKLTSPTNNYGAKSTAKVKNGTFRTYLKFDVSGIAGMVEKVTLRLRVTDGTFDGSTSGGSIFLTSNDFAGQATPWVETLLNAGNAPALTGSPLSTLGAVAANNLVEFDVTSAVTSNGVFSFCIDSDVLDQVKYFTREGTFPPVLSVEIGTGGGGNSAPVAANDSAATILDTPVIVEVLANDNDSDGSLNAATVNVTNPAANGVTSINASTGAITYTPNGSFTGTDQFRYVVQDNSGASSNEATVTIQVTAENLGPVAVNDADTTSEGVAVVIDVLGNDNDPDGTLNVATVTVSTPAANGATVVNGITGAVTYTPNSAFVGMDSFGYTVQDNFGTPSNVAAVTVTVIAASGGGTQTFTFEPTDDAQIKVGNPLKNYGTKGTAKVELNKFRGYYKFNVSGLTGAPQSAVLRLEVTDAVNDGSDSGGSVFASSNNLSGTSTPWTEGVINGGNQPNLISAALSSQGGVAPLEFVEFDVTSAVTGNGTVSFCILSQSANQVKYFTKEGTGQGPQLIIEAPGSGGGGNIAPVANNDIATTPEGIAVTIEVPQNDTDTDGSLNLASVAIVSNPSNGIGTVNFNGRITYTPNTGFTGVDTFSYTIEDDLGSASNVATVTVTVTGAAANAAPVANDDAATTLENQSVIVLVLSNDTDSDGSLNVATVTVTTVPLNGAATVNTGTGEITYTPGAGFTGTDTLGYTVQDDLGAPSNEATVTVTVNASGGGSGQTLTFVPTQDGQVKVTDPTRNYGTKTTSKVEADKFISYYKFVVSGVSSTVQSAVLRLSVTGNGVDGGSVFSVSNNFDATNTPWVETTLTSGNAPVISGSALSSVGPVVAGTLVDFDVTLAVSGNGAVSFAIRNNSTDQVAYHTKEGTTAPQLIITTGSGGGGGGNAAPIAVDDNVTMNAGTSILIDVTLNDSDSDGTIRVTTVALTTSPSNGTATIDGATGVATYTPNAGFNGIDGFSYTVEDNEGAVSNAATVTVTVNSSGNSAPSAQNDVASTTSGVPVLIDVTTNDNDPDGTLDVSTVLVVVAPTDGTVSVNAVTGVITYTPDPTFQGVDTFGYTVRDNAGTPSNTASVSVTVTAGSTSAFTFGPTDDGQVKVTGPTKNYGTKATTKVEKGTFRSYFKFNVTSLSGPITSAKLRLQVTDQLADGSDSGGSIFAASNNHVGTSTPWTEASLTAANSPDLTSAALSTVGTVFPNDVVEFDVTVAVTGNGIFSFCVISESLDQVKYFTKEGLSGPQLIVQTGTTTAAVANETVLLSETAGTSELLPTHFSLEPNFPNPFNPETNIRYSLPEAAEVKLQIFNIRGQLVTTLVNKEQIAGFKTVKWEGTNGQGLKVGSGVYVLRLNAGDRTFTRRLLLQK